MKERKLKNVLITYQDSQPPGVLNVRDALQTLLEKVENEKSLLRDYMMGVGFYWFTRAFNQSQPASIALSASSLMSVSMTG
jgi:hypothetical protein